MFTIDVVEEDKYNELLIENGNIYTPLTQAPRYSFDNIYLSMYSWQITNLNGSSYPVIFLNILALESGYLANLILIWLIFVNVDLLKFKQASLEESLIKGNFDLKELEDFPGS